MTCRSIRIRATLLAAITALVPAVAAPLAAQEGTLEQAIAIFSEEGLKGTPEGLKRAESAYQRARRIAPKDGRVDYAWSIVLTKHRQFEKAEEALDQSIKAEQACLAAKTASVRGLMKSRKHSDAIDALVELAELAGSNGEAHLTANDRKTCARWIGRAAGYFAGPLGDSDLAAEIRRREPALRAYLGEWVSSFDAGWQELTSEHRKLQDDLSLAIAESEGKKVASLRSQQEKMAKLDEAYKSASTEGSKAQGTASERIADINTAIGSLESQFTNLLTAESRLTDAIFQLNIELTRLQIDLDRLNTQHPREYPAAKRIYAQKIVETSVEMELLQTDLSSVWAEKDRVLNRAGSALRARLATLSEQQQIELKKSMDQEKYQRLQRSLQKKTQETASTAAGNSGRAPGLRLKIQNWNSYDRTTPAQELAQLITP